MNPGWQIETEVAMQTFVIINNNRTSMKEKGFQMYRIELRSRSQYLTKSNRLAIT
jgi:hypothetical protein